MRPDKRMQIIETSHKLFLSQGFKQTTTKQIAELAGVNESTIFRLFQTKENLFHQSIAHYTAEMLRIDNEGLTFGKNLEQDIFQLIQKNVTLMKQTIPSFRLLIKGSLMDESLLKEVNIKIHQLQNHFKQYLVGLQRRGLIKEVDFDALVEFLFGAIIHESFLLNIGEVEPADYSRSIEEFSARYASYCCEMLMIRSEEAI
jgi:AcrR family transcriptional regulator